MLGFDLGIVLSSVALMDGWLENLDPPRWWQVVRMMRNASETQVRVWTQQVLDGFLKPALVCTCFCYWEYRHTQAAWVAADASDACFPSLNALMPLFLGG